MSTVIQAQIFQDLQASPERMRLLCIHPEFNMLLSLPPELEGISGAMSHNSEASSSSTDSNGKEDDELRRAVELGRVPTTHEIIG
jgi:hypothetical protein